MGNLIAKQLMGKAANAKIHVRPKQTAAILCQLEILTVSHGARDTNDLRMNNVQKKGISSGSQSVTDIGHWASLTIDYQNRVTS